MNRRLNRPVVTSVARLLDAELTIARRPWLDARACPINSLNSIESTDCIRFCSVLKLIFRVRAAEITAMGEVRYSMPRIGMGVRFVDLSPEYGEAIASVVGENSHTRPVPNGGGWQSSSR